MDRGEVLGSNMPYESGNEVVFEPLPSIVHEAKLDHPSNYTKNKTWYDKSQYANILRGLISAQLTQYKREKNRIKKTRISQNIGYLIQVVASLIRDEKDIEQRIEDLEKLVGIGLSPPSTKLECMKPAVPTVYNNQGSLVCMQGFEGLISLPTFIS